MVFEAIERGVIAKSPAGDEAIQSLQPTPVIVPALRAGPVGSQ